MTFEIATVSASAEDFAIKLCCLAPQSIRNLVPDFPCKNIHQPEVLFRLSISPAQSESE